MNVINLPVSGETKRQPSPSCETSDIQRRLDEAKRDLLPLPDIEVVSELAACLTLVGAGSMGQGDRTEWIKVAKRAIGDIPASAFRAACENARSKCRFANEIVPAIIETAEQQARWIKSRISGLQYQLDHPPVAYLPAPPEDKPLTVEEVLKMRCSLVEMGRKGGWIDNDVLAEVDRIRAEQADEQ